MLLTVMTATGKSMTKDANAFRRSVTMHCRADLLESCSVVLLIQPTNDTDMYTQTPQAWPSLAVSQLADNTFSLHTIWLLSSMFTCTCAADSQPKPGWSITVIVSRVCGAGNLPDGVLEGESKREAGHLLPLPLSPVEVHHSTSNGDVPTGVANQT